jgi:group I intron endonuclease
MVQNRSHAIMAGLYEIVNLKSNRRYVGSSVNIRKRFLDHTGRLNKGIHPNPQLQFAWNRDGSKYFKFRCILLCRIEDVKMFEQRLLDWWSKHDWKLIYNICQDARAPMRGLKFSVEHRQRQGKSIRRAYENLDTRTRLSNSIKSAYNRDPSYAKRVSEGNKTAHSDPEVKERHRIAVKTSHARPETKKKLSRINKGRVFSAETVAKMSISAKLRWSKVVK